MPLPFCILSGNDQPLKIQSEGVSCCSLLYLMSVTARIDKRYCEMKYERKKSSIGSLAKSFQLARRRVDNAWQELGKAVFFGDFHLAQHFQLLHEHAAFQLKLISRH